jgi:hypothetical protein
MAISGFSFIFGAISGAGFAIKPKVVNVLL